MRAAATQLLLVALLGCHGSTATTASPVAAATTIVLDAAAPAPDAPSSLPPSGQARAGDTVPAPVACLARYYTGTPRHDAAGWVLALDGGVAIPLHDGLALKTPWQRFDAPDLTDVFEQRYPAGPIAPVTEVDFDPGRSRVDPLFFATFGATAAAVQKAMRVVTLAGKAVAVHEKVAAPLRRVAARIDALLRNDPSLGQFFHALGGTFNWRTIAGSDRLSMHSWAIAIDLDVGTSFYWRNELGHGSEASLKWKNRLPQSIVDAFEAEGFIWGGRWYHYDTMHFEYRPELLDPTCYP